MFSWILIAVNGGIIATYICLRLYRQGKWRPGGKQFFASPSDSLSWGIFMYNGHSFDAFEVLGISRALATSLNKKDLHHWLEAKSREIRLRDSSEQEFLKAALNSLRK